MTTPARFSKLNDREHCGFSGSFEDQTTNLAAMKGDAFHALNAAHYRPKEDAFQEARALAMSVIPTDEHGEIAEMAQRLWDTWTPPENGRFEVAVGIDRRGIAVPYNDKNAIVRGTADYVETDGDLVVVVDFKSGARASWNVPHPSVNLQLIGYGLAFADLLGKSKVRLGVYLAAEGEWRWAEYDLDSGELTKQWERVRAAALRDPNEAITGPHCADCWIRLRCRAHLVPAVSDIDRESAFAIMASPVEGPIEPQKLLRLLNATKALEDLAEAGKEFAKAYVSKFGPLIVDDKAWGAIPMAGRESVSIASLRAAGLYERAVSLGAIKQGGAGKQHRWVKASTLKAS